MRKLIVFDMDGTIADTSLGIINCVKYTQKKLNLPEIKFEQILSHIGPPMEESYARNFGLSGEMLKNAVTCHREYAISRGYKEIKIYNGIPELLSMLKKRGSYTAVATLKAQPTAEKILKEFKLDALFDLVIGTDIEQPMPKSQIVKLCINRLGCKKSETVFIGDSAYDAVAATEIGIDFIAALYGLGFKTESDAKKFNYVYACNNVQQLIQYFSSI